MTPTPLNNLLMERNVDLKPFCLAFTPDLTNAVLADCPQVPLQVLWKYFLEEWIVL